MARVGTCGYGYHAPPEGRTDEYESELRAFADTLDRLEADDGRGYCPFDDHATFEDARQLREVGER